MLGGRLPDGIDVPSWEAQQEETVRMTSITIGLDFAKLVFQMHAEDAEGRTVTQRRLRRSQVVAFFARQPASVVGIEACGSAHYWGRLLRALGHEVRLSPAAYVKPFARCNKTDAQDTASPSCCWRHSSCFRRDACPSTFSARRDAQGRSSLSGES
jgi:hypothetical protein